VEGLRISSTAESLESIVRGRAFAARRWYEGLLLRFRGLIRDHPSRARKLGLGAMLAALLVAGAFAALSMRQWAEYGIHRPLTLDFALYRACAIQGTQYGWNQLYDVDLQRHVYQAQEATYPTAGTMAFAPNVCTPLEGWITLPFILVALPIGYLLWSVLIFAATVFAFWTLAPGGVLARLVQVCLALIPYPVLLSLSEGQVTSFQIAGVAACWLLLRRGRDGWAGIALLPLALKPQTLLMVPLALLVIGRFRTFAFWLVGTFVLGLAVLANLGLDGTIAYVHRIQFASSNPAEYLGGPWYNLTAHFTTRFGRLGAEALAVVMTLFVAWRHRRSGPEVPIAAGLIGSLLVAPYLHLDDFITMFPAAWLILRAHPRWWLWVLMAGGYVDALLCTDTGTARWGEGLLLFELTVMILLCVIRVTQPSGTDATEERDPEPSGGRRLEAQSV
jgi:Glycosyltransferase family 87